MRQLTHTRLVAVVALLLLVACGEDNQPPVAIDATASVVTACIDMEVAKRIHSNKAFLYGHSSLLN